MHWPVKYSKKNLDKQMHVRFCDNSFYCKISSDKLERWSDKLNGVRVSKIYSLHAFSAFYSDISSLVTFCGIICKNLPQNNILCKINLAIVFVCIRSIISGFYCHFIASRYKCRSPKKDFPCFYNIDLKQFLISISLIVCVCTAVWCLPTC